MQPLKPELLPNSEALERRVLAAMLVDVDNHRTVLDSVNASDFFSPLRAKFFSLLSQHEKPDALLTGESIRAHFGAEHAAAWDEWSAIVTCWSSSESLEEHCQHLRQLALARRVATTCLRIASEALEGIESPGDYLDRSEVAFGKAVSSREDLLGDEQISDGMVETIEIVKATQTGSQGSGHMCQIRDVDAIVGGFKPGALYVVAGRPSMGKSAFATQLALELAQHGYMQFTSCEMAPHEIRVRLLSGATGIDSRLIERNQLSATQWARVQDAGRDLSQLRFGWTRGVRTIEGMRRSARAAMRRQGELGGLLVDYLQLLRSEERFGSRELEIAHISRELKLLAEELRTPVIAVSQLSRKCEERADRRPLMSDLRESGAIEQDADCVLLLYRDDYYNEKTEEPGTCEVNVAKNRGGMTGTCKVLFDRTCTRFRPLWNGGSSPNGFAP